MNKQKNTLTYFFSVVTPTKKEETKPEVTPTEDDTPSKPSHTHSYSYEAISDTQHKGTCSCGDTITSNHSFEYKHVEEKCIKYCTKCGYEIIETHDIQHTHDGETCIEYCTKCDYYVENEHDYFDENNSKFFISCPNCEATLGTEEIPWHVTNSTEFSKVVSGHYKQTEDITFTSDVYSKKPHDCVYDGNNHKAIIGYDDSYHYKYLFYNPYTSFKVKNLDFYSNDTTLCVLLYNVGAERPNLGYGDINVKLSVENCNAKSVNGNTVELSATNATVFFWNNAYMNYSLQGKYTPGITELSFKNCCNYVSFYNKSPSASVMMAIAGACDDWAKTEFINCHNYGNVSSNSAAGLISSHLYTNNYANYWTAEQLADAITVENCNNFGTIKAPNYIGMFCDANGDNKDGNGQSFVDLLNQKFNGLGPNYIKSTPLSGDYAICYDGGNFKLKTNEENDYDYQLRIGFGNITTPGIGFSNTQAIFFDLNKVESGTEITANKLHAYDIDSAIAAGIVESANELDFKLNNAYHVALKSIEDTLYIIFSSEDRVQVDTNCSFGIHAYSNGQSAGYKELN